MARNLWIACVAGLSVVAVTLIGIWVWPKLSADPLLPIREAYERRDWSATRTLAMGNLKEHPNDVESLRLLARANGRMSRDELAQELFGRVGDAKLQAEDFFILGSGFVRLKQLDPALAVLERARGLDPRHGETLNELTRLYARIGRMPEALLAASQLSKTPGWESRGSVVLGVLKRESTDPTGVSEALNHALQLDPLLSGAILSPDAARRLLARSLLELGQPTKAKTNLETLVTKDAELAWLLSRAYLQEGNAAKASEFLSVAGNYGTDDPTRPEPSPYVGAKACEECHKSIYANQQKSRHSETLYLPKDLVDLPLPGQPIPDSVQANLSHLFKHERGTIQLESRVGDQIHKADVEYGIGSGNHGLTMMGRDKAGEARMFRVSSFNKSTSWGLTPFVTPPDPADAESVIGTRFSEEALHKCLDCHRTSPRAARDPLVIEAADHGIGCERCHGPGGNHLAAVSANFADLAIARPRLASPTQVNKICATCHGSDDTTTDDSDPRTIRFQALTMPRSRCFTESGGALSCVTCHDPHRNAETSSVHYEAQCLSCHSVSPQDPSPTVRHAVLPEGKSRKPCPVNPSKDCLTCHMPTKSSPAHRASFTDHHIRVH